MNDLDKFRGKAEKRATEKEAGIIALAVIREAMRAQKTSKLSNLGVVLGLAGALIEACQKFGADPREVLGWIATAKAQ